MPRRRCKPRANQAFQQGHDSFRKPDNHKSKTQNSKLIEANFSFRKSRMRPSNIFPSIAHAATRTFTRRHPERSRFSGGGKSLP
jgi:hypothetical protein